MKDKVFSEELKRWFKGQGITQKEIAERLNITQGAVNSLLNGKAFGAKTAYAWSKEFGLSEVWLLRGEGPMIPGHITQTVSGNENNISGVGSVSTGVPANLHEKALNEIAEQRKCYQANINRLLAIIENMQEINKK